MTPEQNMQSELAARHEARQFFSNVGFALLTLLVANTVGEYVLAYVTQVLWPWALTQWWYSWMLSFVPLYGIGLPLFWLALRRVCTSPFVGVEGAAPFKARMWLLLFAVAVGYMYIGSVIGQNLLDVISGVTGKDYVNILSSRVDQTPLWFTLLGAAVLAPIGEELLFRKLLIDRMRAYGDTVSVFLSATLFALFHGNLYQFFYAWLVGLILGYLYTRTGKLLWSIVLHMALNAWGILIPRLTERLPLDVISSLSGDELTAYVAQYPWVLIVILVLDAVVYGSMLAAVILTLRCRRRLVLRHNPRSMSRDGLFSAAWGSAGVALTVAACVLSMVLKLL